MVRDDELLKIAAGSHSVADVMKKLGLIPAGGNHRLYKERLKRLGHTKFKKRPYNASHQRPLDDYLVLNGPSINTSKLRQKLLRAALKEEKCEICGLGRVWNEKSLTLHLDHIDGNRRNNTLKNLRLVCPNCHSQTPTYAMIKPESRAKNTPCVRSRLNSGVKCKCGKRIQKRNKTKLCRKCYREEYPPPRKVSNRPSLDALIQEIKQVGFRATGRKYGVSDNAVRKWLKRMSV